MVSMQPKQGARSPRRRILPVLFAVVLPAVPLCAQLSISNPSLPPQEYFLYAENIQDQSGTVSQSMSFKSANGDSWYEFTSKSSESEVTMRLDAVTLFARSSEVITRSGDSLIRRTTEILAATPHAKQGELMIGDYASLPVTLRGLPWGTFTQANLVTLGAPRGSGQVSVQLTVAGHESISTGGKTWDCWKVQLGLGGLLGAFFAKSTYWFAAEAPHVLVKSEVPTGGPGSPTRVMELQRYSTQQ
jgi:hypothetical protein